MGSGTKLVSTVIREIERANKAAERDRIKREKEFIRRENQLQKLREKEQRENLRLQKQLSKQQIKAEKNRITKELEKEKSIFENRVNSRRELRLKYINKKYTGA